nr:hypothetical protein HK105_001844 [Polyrhizophydium stewartii]
MGNTMRSGLDKMMHPSKMMGEGSSNVAGTEQQNQPGINLTHQGHEAAAMTTGMDKAGPSTTSEQPQQQQSQQQSQQQPQQQGQEQQPHQHGQQQHGQQQQQHRDAPIYHFGINDIDGNPVDLTQFQGRVLLLVNTASKCATTPWLGNLEKLYEKHRDQGFVVLAFPCNQFMGEEPLQPRELKEFYQRNYAVSFPIMEKIDVNGNNAHPLFQYIKREAPGVMGLEAIKWNFEKFLVGRNGNVIRRFPPTTNPDELEPEIAKALLD